MKITHWLAPILAVGLFAGCKPSTQEQSAKPESTTAQQLDKAKTAGNVAAERMRDFSYDQKAEFIATMKAEVATLNENINELSAKVEKSSAAVQADAKPKLAALREQVAQMQKQLEAVVDSTPSTWSSIKADYEKAYASVKEGVKQTRQWMSEKIAP